jgi:hypothetical protein
MASLHEKAVTRVTCVTVDEEGSLPAVLRELDTRHVASPSPGSTSPVGRVASPKAHGKLLSVTPMTLMTHG